MNGEAIDRSQVNEIEYEILSQYQIALRHLKKVNQQIQILTSNDPSSTTNTTSTTELINTLRFLENKIGLLFTLIKSSAFSFIVKHQQDIDYDNDNNNNNDNTNDDRGGFHQSLDGTVNITLDSTK